MAYEVFIIEKARHKFEKIREKELKERLKEAFKLLAEPFSLDTIKLGGVENRYRTRIGKYRILEVIQDGKVWIVDFDHRGKVYKRL